MKKIKLTKRGRYAMMAMVSLTKSTQDAPISLAKIACTHDISISYLEQLMSKLRRNGLVKSYRGPGGGYILERPTHQIMISDILHAAENNTNTLTKLNACQHTDALWLHIEGSLYQWLTHISLQDILDNNLGSDIISQKQAPSKIKAV